MITLADSNIRILAPLPELHYFDTQSVSLARETSPLEVWNAMMRDPQPLLNVAFKIRDAISSLFGVKRIGGFSGQQTGEVNIGDRLDFFLVEYVDATTLVLTERDRHLDVMTCLSTDGATVTTTSSVCVHNLFGRIYMIPVGIAHRWIVRAMLRKLAQNITAT